MSASHSFDAPFRLECIKPFIPRRVQPWIFVAIAVALQCSNIVYPACSAHMYGELSLLREDTTMCLYAMFAGMNIAFPMMWRFKFRFTTRSILTITLSTLAVCNLMAAYTHCFPLLLALCTVGGFVKIWGTFECISSINPWMAPNFNFQRFFPLLYTMILGPIYLSILIDTPLTYYFSWREMHWAAIGVFLVLLLLVRTALTDVFPMGRQPLRAVDFTGMAIWTALMLQMSFIAIYGEHYHWLHSPEIRLATGSCLITLGGGLWRMFNIRHPYIDPQALYYRRVPVALLLFFLTDAIMETPNSLQNILTNELLGFDTMNTVRLNWFALAGTLSGCLFSLWWMSKKNYPTLRLAFFGIALSIVYQGYMYFLTSQTAALSYFYVPTFVRTFGYAAVYCALTYYLKKYIPFDHFLQVLAVVGIVRSGIGGSVGDAIYGYALRWATTKNAELSGYMLDGASGGASALDFGLLQGHIVAVSIKELWGWTILFALAALLTAILLHLLLGSKSVLRGSRNNEGV